MRLSLQEANEMAVRYYPLAIRLAGEWARRHPAAARHRVGEDALGEALLALVCASRAYDRDAGAAFVTYAHVAIRNRLHRLWADTLLVRVPAGSAARRSGLSAKCRERMTEALGFAPQSLPASGGLLTDPHPDGDVAALAARRDEADRLARMMRKLPAGQRQLLRWRYWREFTYGEIGRRLGIGKEVARVRVRKALLALRRVYPHGTPGPGESPW